MEAISLKSTYTDKVNQALQQRLGEGYFIAHYFASEVKTITMALQRKIARCYRDVFNESWNEDWTEKTALTEVKKALTIDKGRTPLITLLYKDNEIVGFHWAHIIKDMEYLHCDDVGLHLTEHETKAGKATVRNWFNAFSENRDSALCLREMGAKRINGVSPFLFAPVLDYALFKGVINCFMSTSYTVPMFDLARGMGLTANHFYWNKDNLVLVMGSTKTAFKQVSGMIEGRAINKTFRRMVARKCAYYTSN